MIVVSTSGSDFYLYGNLRCAFHVSHHASIYVLYFSTYPHLTLSPAGCWVITKVCWILTDYQLSPFSHGICRIRSTKM